MATNLILPALGMAQDTGKIVRWLKTEGEPVVKGEPVAEIETDKATVELEAPATGQLVNILARDGDEVPVGHVIATILAAGELPRENNAAPLQASGLNGNPSEDRHDAPRVATDAPVRSSGVVASPLAARIAAEHNLDHSEGRRAVPYPGTAKDFSCRNPGSPPAGLAQSPATGG